MAAPTEPKTPAEQVAVRSASEVHKHEREVHGLDPAQGIGIALSGGGVRSAAFCLGALEELERTSVGTPPVRRREFVEGEDAAPRLLDHAQFLSTVSGGGFTGALWVLLTEQARRLTGEAGRVASDRVRSRASYLAPGSFLGPNGLFEGASSYLVGVLLNLTSVFALAGVCMSFYAVFSRLAAMQLAAASVAQVALACLTVLVVAILTIASYSQRRERRTWVLDATIALGSLSIATVVGAVLVGLPGWLTDMSVARALLVFGGLWVVFFAVAAQFAVLFTDRSKKPSAVLRIERRRRLAVACMVLAGIALLNVETSLDVLGLGDGNRGVFSSEMGPATGMRWVLSAVGGYAGLAAVLGIAVDRLRRSPGIARPILTTLTACGAALTLLLLGVAHGAIFDVLATDHHFEVGEVGPSSMYALACLATIGLIQLVLTFALPDTTTTHHLFRDRITAAFFPAEVDETAGASARRQLHHYAKSSIPFWIINSALNDPIASADAPRRQRAVLFTYTPSHCGADAEGYGFVRTERYGFRKPPIVAQALTTSAAVVAPTMGEYSAFWIWVVANLLNLRLGVNARRPFVPEGHSQEMLAAEWPRLTEPIDSLAAALNDWLRRSFAVVRGMLPGRPRSTIYLTDGGHYDNTGVLSLIARRCRFIIAVDGEQDAGYACQGLADVVRKARLYHSTTVTIDVRGLAPTSSERTRFAVGALSYPDGTEGLLIYLKAVSRGDEPTDVRNYALVNPEFPQESTANQFFSTSQFEAYRSLGAVTVKDAFRPAKLLLALSGEQGAWLRRVFTTVRWAHAAPEAHAAAGFHGTSDRWLQLLKDPTSTPALDAALLDPLAKAAGLSADQVRASLAVFQHMENVFYACRLGVAPYADENAGWMRLFASYARSDVLRGAWAHAAVYYSESFRQFCDAHLAELGAAPLQLPAEAPSADSRTQSAAPKT